MRVRDCVNPASVRFDVAEYLRYKLIFIHLSYLEWVRTAMCTYIILSDFAFNLQRSRIFSELSYIADARPAGFTHFVVFLGI